MPAISPETDKVAFVNDITSNADLFLQPFRKDIGAVGKPQQIFSAQHATQASPTFSPDGKQIAFVSNKDGLPRVYVMKVPENRNKQKTMPTRLLTKRNVESTAPAWSPDGHKVAYCSKTNGIRQIWMINLETGEEKQITNGPGHKENPSWAPNSLHLIYNSASEESSELYLTHIHHNRAVKISLGSGEKRFPCWEPRINERKISSKL